MSAWFTYHISPVSGADMCRRRFTYPAPSRLMSVAALLGDIPGEFEAGRSPPVTALQYSMLGPAGNDRRVRLLNKILDEERTGVAGLI